MMVVVLAIEHIDRMNVAGKVERPQREEGGEETMRELMPNFTINVS